MKINMEGCYNKTIVTIGKRELRRRAITEKNRRIDAIFRKHGNDENNDMPIKQLTCDSPTIALEGQRRKMDMRRCFASKSVQAFACTI
jgi:hypothetical protein